MSKLSNKKIEKIKEQILHLLFENNLRSLFTSHIAEELARDEEFVLILLNQLHKKGFIQEISKNVSGKEYLARRRWRLKPKVYEQYKKLAE